MSLPYPVHRPLRWYGSAGSSAGKRTCCDPMAAISAATILVMASMTSCPSGRVVTSCAAFGQRTRGRGEREGEYHGAGTIRRWHDFDGEECMVVRSFVAMGDSFTEGLDDPNPDGSGFRGWADLMATALAARAADAGTDFRYANLAVRGRLFDGVVEGQVPQALAMRADVYSFAAGGNDALRRGFDAASMLARFDATVAALRADGAQVLLFRFADLSRRLPGKRILRPRIDALNVGVFASAKRHGARVVDLWVDDQFDNASLWSTDRLHLSTAGHQRVAAAALAELDLPPEPAWLDPVAPPAPLAWTAARGADARWVREHLVPWVGRRLAGRSSGDTVAAKRPVLTPLSGVERGPGSGTGG
jgi:lysophospholipase L1-like esterase